MGKQRLTNDREVHLEAHKLEELEAVHVRHVDIADHKVKLVLLLPQQLQGCGCLSSCCHCGITNPDRLAHIYKSKPGGTHYTCGSQIFVRITRLRGKLERRTFLPLKKIKPRKTEIDSQKFAQHKIYRNYTAGGLKLLEREDYSKYSRVPTHDKNSKKNL